MAKIGRPVEKPDPKICDAVIAWIEAGKTLREFCRQKGMPSYGTIYAWLNKDELFAERFARARDIGLDVIADETLEIIDTFPVEALSGDGKRLDSAHVAWLRNRVDQRMKLLAVWKPSKYGAKVDVTSEGKGLNITIDLGDQK
jgi:hypothetical protein